MVPVTEKGTRNIPFIDEDTHRKLLTLAFSLGITEHVWSQIPKNE